MFLTAHFDLAMQAMWGSAKSTLDIAFGPNPWAILKPALCRKRLVHCQDRCFLGVINMPQTRSFTCCKVRGGND